MDILQPAHLFRKALHLFNVIFITVHATQSHLICILEDVVEDIAQSTSRHILRQALDELNLTSADLALTLGSAHGMTWTFSDGRPGNCSVVLVAAKCQRSDMLRPLFSNSSVPVVVYSNEVCDDTYTLSPWSPSTWTRALADVIVTLGWTDVIFVFDERSLESHQQALMTELSRHQVGMVAVAATGHNIAASVTSTIITSHIYSILVCIGSSSATLDLAHTSLVHNKYSWIVACPTLRPLDLQPLLQNVSNMAALFILSRGPLRDSASSPALCDSGNFTAMAISRVKSALSQTFPELFVSCYGRSRPLKCAEEDMTYTERLQRFNQGADEYVLCTRQANDPFSFQPVGTWSSDAGLTIPTDVLFQNQFRDFQNASLRVGVWEAVPFLKRISNQGGHVVYEGLCMDILDELSYRLNFRYQLIEPPDGQFGAPDANGTWNGMIAMLMQGVSHSHKPVFDLVCRAITRHKKRDVFRNVPSRVIFMYHDIFSITDLLTNELDLAIGPFTITSVREAVIDFTVPYMEDGGGILTKGGEPAPDLLNIFRPFPFSVWMILCACILTTGTVLFTIARVGAKHVHQVSSSTQQASWSLDDCLLLTFSSLMAQGFERYPSCTAGRLVVGCWWVFSILIVSMYTATLAAMLTVTVRLDAIDSIDDLAESSLTPITIAGTSWQTLFLTADGGIFAQVGSRMANAPVIRTDADAMFYVYEGSAAYVLDLNIVSYLYSQDCKNLHMAKNVFVNNGLGFAVPENAAYRETINAILLKLQESGLLELWRQKWWKTFLDCGNHGASVRSSQKLGFISIGGVLILYAAVIAVAIACLFFQLFYKHRKSCRNLKRYDSPTDPPNVSASSQRSFENKASGYSSENVTRQCFLSSDA